MGVFDDIKDSLNRSDSSGSGSSGFESSSSGNDGFGDSQFDSSFDDSGPNLQDSNQTTRNQQQNPSQSLNDRPAQPQNNGQPMQNRSGGQSQPNEMNAQGNSPQQEPGQGLNDRGGTRGNNARRSRENASTPNAQAGRPQEGGSEPQLSSQTRKKLDNAGLSDPSDPDFQETRGRQRQNSTDSVADRQDDLEQIKSQNQQIIELLKRINSNLNPGGRSQR